MTSPVHPGWRAWRGRLFASFIWLSGGGVVVGGTVLALIVLSGMRNQYADLLAQFTAPAFAGLVLTAAGLALFRFWRLAAAAIVPVLLLGVAVWPQWFPDGSTAASGAPAISVYSANLYIHNDDVEAIAASIRQADADVVMLIELGDATAPRLDDLIAGYPHRITSPRVDRPKGGVRSVIASRYPLTRLPRVPEVEAVAARARTPLGDLNLVSVHLTRPWPFEESWGQISQTMALTGLVNGLQGPVVVAGDFNSVSSARIGRQVRTDMSLTAAPGFPGTWPSFAPSPLSITIDQVYVSAGLAVVNRRLGRPNGSDHRPVIVGLTRAAP
ncbi:MAG TPA: endonuclease/exonuclease/phosphatase family protein [Brevundimonas sp.]|nr:endonuclease/exonuclease/phosphatase family protein [Brevundimonas sp.]